MKQVSVDFSEIEEFEPLPVGDYPVIVQEVQTRQAEEAEYPYLNWELRIAEGEFENRALWMITSFSPKSLWRLQAVLQNLGIYTEKMEFEIDEDSDLVISPQLTGIAAIAVVKQEVYRGRLQNRVEDLLPIKSGASVIKVKKLEADKTPKPAPEADEDSGDAPKKKSPVSIKLK